MSNFYPSIPDPLNNTESVADSVRALKMAVETLTGQRDGGAATRIYEQQDEPKNPRVGDTWVEKKDAGRMRIWNGHFWVDVSDSRFTTLEKAIGDANASIKEALAVSVTDTEALASKITELQASFSGSLATVNNQLLVRATAEEALAQKINTLRAQSSANAYNSQAAINEEQTVRASGDSALASSISSLSATVTSNYNTLNASITNEQTARVNGDTANATSINALTTTVTNNYNTLNASITNEQTARVNGDAANADSISTLTSTVNGNTTSITTLQSTTSSVTGALSAQWSMVMELDGATGGMKLNGVKKADGTGAQFDLVLNSNVTIKGDLVVDGTITTSKIRLNAITKTVFVSAQSGVAGSSGTVSISVPAGSVVVVRGSYSGGDYVDGGYGQNIVVSLNGATIGVGAIPTDLESNGSAFIRRYYWGAYISASRTISTDQTVTAACSIGTGGFNFQGTVACEILVYQR